MDYGLLGCCKIQNIDEQNDDITYKNWEKVEIKTSTRLVTFSEIA
jgi:hypothetical protein